MAPDAQRDARGGGPHNLYVDASVGIIGAGPAGLMAAIHAAGENVPVLVVEANAAPGRKLLITGGGRCNFTHAGSPEEIARAFGKPGRFLRHSLYESSPEAVREFFEARGLPSTVEADGCLFPTSNRASEVLDVLVKEVERLGVRCLYGSRVTEIATDGSQFTIGTGDQRITVARAIIATGGLSWPQTGSRGDGYQLAGRLGHMIIPPKPSLVPLVTRETWPGELAGVSLSGVELRATRSNRKCRSVGNVLFTQNGIGGPAAQDLSRFLTDELPYKDGGIPIEIDTRPVEGEPQLDTRMQRMLQSYANKTVANVLSELLPRQLAHMLCRLAECNCGLQAGRCAADQRKRLVRLLKHLPLHITGTEPIAKATVTRGGVSREEIEPRTLESRIRPGLFFAGEVIDLDGPCGGYNLQACWSTGAVAGRSAARSLAAPDPLVQ